LIVIGISGKDLNPLLLGELCGRNPLKTAVGPDFVVVLAPFSNAISGLLQALKPLLIQAFISELSIEALDVVVLHGPARLNQDVATALQCGTSQLGSACEFRHVICANSDWVTSENCGLIKKPSDILASDSKVHCNFNALVDKVIGNSQAFDFSAVRQTVCDIIHVLNIIDLACDLKRHTLVWWALNFLTVGHRQVDIIEEPIDTFVIYPRKL
jgi:hypothetical protein